MDASFVFQGQRFVWNTEKAFDNFVKHGTSFEQACEVFFDPFVRMEDAGIASENREAVIGVTDDRTVLFVVNMLFEADDSLRIISARPATAKERRRYEDSDRTD